MAATTRYKIRNIRNIFCRCLGAQIEILIAEIPEDLQQKAKRRVCLAMDKYDIEKDIATDVKKHFDEECEGSWHCVVRFVMQINVES